MILQKEFEIYLKIDKSYSENTIISYLSHLRHFNNYCKKNLINVLNVEYNDLTNFLKYLKGDLNYKSKTINSYISCLKNYYKFLVLEKYIDNNPCSLLDSPKIEKKLPVYLTEVELITVINSIDRTSNLGKRDYLIFALLYDTGVRVSELININLNNIDFSNKCIKILGKGNKERLVYFTDITLNLLTEYIYKILNINEIKFNYLFSKKNGKILSRFEVYNIINKYCKNAGINKNVTPHTIRHTFATHMIQNDADIMSVKTILGHSNISTTQLYTHLNNKDLKNKYDLIMERKRKNEI